MPDKLVHHRVAKQLLALIDSGVYAPGSRLPSERELATQFGVGRGAVRNAEKMLEMQGHIEIKVGSGVYVLGTPSLHLNVMPNVSPLELTEARALFEAESAALAAPIITDETIAELEHYISIMTIKQKSEMTPDDADAAFHKAIARATNNNMIIFVIDTMWTLRAENFELQKVYRKVCDSEPSHREGEHHAILEAFKQRDSNAARKAMRAHFTRIIEALLDSSEQEAYEKVEAQVSTSRERFLLTTQIG
ncbi:FadR/GntR family transcriptional regulator [Fretibacter rubidus]|uniref:FadR/GntR family transcriptional regulator n=1 Tax=Fretibacter rubidus TaxID=570162 RepID=UPI00352AFCBA